MTGFSGPPGAIEKGDGKVVEPDTGRTGGRSNGDAGSVAPERSRGATHRGPVVVQTGVACAMASTGIAPMASPRVTRIAFTI